MLPMKCYFCQIFYHIIINICFWWWVLLLYILSKRKTSSEKPQTERTRVMFPLFICQNLCFIKNGNFTRTLIEWPVLPGIIYLVDNYKIENNFILYNNKENMYTIFLSFNSKSKAVSESFSIRFIEHLSVTIDCDVCQEWWRHGHMARVVWQATETLGQTAGNRTRPRRYPRSLAAPAQCNCESASGMLVKTPNEPYTQMSLRL